ncbi:hypothetical protein SDC9_102097 [bioreactor metagenome]|uniref:Uncharacterized protein n=1 Tax=bioreactor metagenome TaxID=1076179 RepID=A0A645AWM2_9ZZZZ
MLQDKAAGRAIRKIKLQEGRKAPFFEVIDKVINRQPVFLGEGFPINKKTRERAGSLVFYVQAVKNDFLTAVLPRHSERPGKSGMSKQGKVNLPKRRGHPRRRRLFPSGRQRPG